MFKPVRIRIVTKIDNGVKESDFMLDEISRYTMEATLGENADESENPIVNAINASDDGNPIMLEAKGTLYSEDGQIKLEYTSHLSAPFPTTVIYRFNEDTRNALTVQRQSLFERVYFFDTACKSQTVFYEAEGSSIELSIYTKSLKNHLNYEEGGYIEIEYFAQLRGGMLEHCREYVLVEPIQ
jgi:uncharacterized beta-barrel protein YwiB (DUF1934 family)